VITDGNQRPKLDPGEDIPADAPWTVVTVGSAEWERLAGAAPTGAPAAVGGPDAAMVQLYTSGTTGKPKGVIVPARALASMVAYQELALDVTADDVFWNAADPGWAYGLYYALLAPLATGRRTLLLDAGFSARTTWEVLGRFGVTSFAAAPTVYRGLRASGIVPPEGLRLRTCSSAGEPLNPDLVTWGREVLGVEVRDHYGQTELGMVVANAWHPDLRAEIRPGSMGRALPGFRVAVLADDAEQEVAPDTPGRVALDVPASPLLWFDGYAGGVRGDRFSEDGRWYLTGDAGRADADGYLYFSARDDDVIIMAGYRIGPFDVESVLSTHPAVAEVAVVGMPDELRGEVVEAFVVLREGAEAGPDLPDELARLVRTRYAAHAYPRRVHVVDALPKTPSGKVQRFLLRQRGR
jgi:acetyl-CoA synthetase